MKKQLDKLELKDLLTTIGLYMPIIDLAQCFNDENIAEEFVINQHNMDHETMVNLMKKYEKKLNKKKYIFTNYLYICGHKRIKGVDIIGQITNRQDKIDLIGEFLRENPVILLDADYENLKGKIYDSRDFVSESQKKVHKEEKEEAKKRIAEIDERIDISYFLLVQILTDIEEAYIRVPDMGNLIRDNIMIKTHENEANGNRDYIVRLLNGEQNKDKPFYEYLPAFKEELFSKAEYLDWDKFLLLSAFRAKDTLNKIETADFPEGNKEVLQEMMIVAAELIKNRKTRIRGNLEFVGEGKKQVRYSLQDLEKDIEERIIDGTYYGDADLQRIREELLSGKIKISDIYSKKVIKLLKLTPLQREQCMKLSEENALDLLKNGFSTENEMKKYITQNHLSIRTIKELMAYEKMDKKKFLTPIDVIELYLNGNVELNVMSGLKDEILEQITEKKLVELYKRLENADTDEKNRIEKYFSLYRELKIREADSEERNEIGNEIIMQLGDDMEEEDFVELYRRNLIPIDTLIEWNGEEFVAKMLSDGLLKPKDTKKLLKEDKIKIDEIKRKMLINGLTDEEKISLIITTFDAEDEEYLREELFQTLKISEDERNYTTKKTNEKARRNEPKMRGKEYILDPCYKMQLLMLIDKDYTYTLTKDGHMIIELPNLNQVIIEKMFKRTKTGVEIADGSATYRMGIEEYKSQNILTEDAKIDRTKLYSLCKEEKAERYYHTKSWGETIRDAFTIKDSDRHTEEDKRKIDETIEKIKRTRRLKEI